MIMNSAAYGWGRTECTAAVEEVRLDSMLARVNDCCLGDGGGVCEILEINVIFKTGVWWNVYLGI